MFYTVFDKTLTDCKNDRKLKAITPLKTLIIYTETHAAVLLYTRRDLIPPTPAPYHSDSYKTVIPKS